MDSAQNPFYALTSNPVLGQGGRVNREMKDVVDGQRVGLRGVMGCCGDIYCALKSVAIATRWLVSCGKSEDRRCECSI